MFVNRKIQGALDRLRLSFGFEDSLRAPDFRRIQLKMLVNSLARCRHWKPLATGYHPMYIISIAMYMSREYKARLLDRSMGL